MADAAPPSTEEVAASLATSTIADGAAPGGGDTGEAASKSGPKKDPKAAKKAERLAARQQQQAAAASTEEDDPLAANYGDLPAEALQSAAITGRVWVPVGDLSSRLAGQVVLVRARVHNVRAKGKMGFLVLRGGGCTVQCVLAVGGAHVSKGMVKYAGGLSKESVVDVEGEVVTPDKPIDATTQQVELHLRSLRAVSRAVPVLPLSIEDAARSDREIEEAEKSGIQFVRVGQDTRLNHRVLDLRTPANQAIFKLQSAVSQLFRSFLLSEGFLEIHTPKLIGGSSEGGAAVFRLDYKGQPACLAQSPQLYKQMAVCADMGRVFEIGPVFRAEDSFTHRHLCEFTGMDFEMEIKEHYAELMDMVNSLFVSLFDGLNQQGNKDLEAVGKQYPFEPLKYTKDGVRITFAEGMEMLKSAGYSVDPFGDINTEQERRLGELVKEKFGVDFYIMHRYPLAARPFYTMPCPDDKRYTNSYDVFIRGEEILSGAQRIHDPEFLAKRAEECGIDVKTIAPYIEAFKFGTVPHGGIGVGLERVVMLFCGLNNIRKASMFPRDPQRLAP